jgi:hypothetical protein
MSIGISLLSDLYKKATLVLGTGFDVEIVEKHHNQKIDAPSGTALMLYNAVNDSLQGKRFLFMTVTIQDRKEAGMKSVSTACAEEPLWENTKSYLPGTMRLLSLSTVLFPARFLPLVLLKPLILLRVAAQVCTT